MLTNHEGLLLYKGRIGKASSLLDTAAHTTNQTITRQFSRTGQVPIHDCN